MASRGLGQALRPVLYIGIALLAHGALFLLPWGRLTSVTKETNRVRGVRVRVVAETPRPPSAPAPVVPVPVPTPPKTAPPTQAPASVESARSYSMVGGGNPGSAPLSGDASNRGIAGQAASPAESEYGAYLARLKSEDIQGWAREAAAQGRQGWKGSGKSAGRGWSGGSGSGRGRGSGDVGRGGGAGSATGARYLDPRVKMVVTSYDLATGSFRERLDGRLPQVPYPDLKVKQHQVAAGWWNVFFQIRTDRTGRVLDMKRLRPETEGPNERIFIEQVRRHVEGWTFDPAMAEINVDVRFYVE